MAVLGAHTAHASVIQMTPNNIGLVGYWSFNEGTSTIAHDFSGNGNNGTLSGSTLPAWTSGKFGNGLSFDGSTSYVDIANSSGVADNLSAMTVSAWFKTTNTSGNGQNIVAKDTSVNNGVGWALFTDGGSAFICLGVSGSVYTCAGTTANVADGKWHHAVWTMTGNSFAAQTIYIDGIAQSLSNVSGGTVSSFSNGVDIYIGADAGSASNDQKFNGSIDEVRIYNRALTATEVAGLYQSGAAKINSSQSPGTLSNGLVGWWTMDGADTVWSSATAGTEIDKSGNGNIGTLNGMTQSGSPTVGKIGQALRFDGSSSYVDITNSSGVADNLTNFSVSAWFKSSASIPGDAEIVSKFGAGGIATGEGWSLDIHGNALIGIIQGAGGSTYAVKETAVTVTDGKWHHGVMVVTGGNTVALYFDGQNQTGSAVGGTVTSYTNASNIRVGNDYNSKLFPGTIDDVRVYNRALSASEVQQLYGLGAGTHANTSSTNLQNGSTLQSGLVGLWTFDGSDISGSTIYDLSGNGNNGTNNGATPTIGKLGQALKFDGSSSYVDTGITSEATFSNATFTLSAWEKNTTDNELFGKWGYSQGFHMGSDWAQLKASNYTRNSDGTINVNDGKWHLITYVITTDTSVAGNNSIHIYQDGVLHDGSTSGSGTYTPATGHSLTIGARLETGQQVYFEGLIDDVRVYNRALSASEVQQLYLMGK